LYVNLERGYKFAQSTSIRLSQNVSWVATDKIALTAGAFYENLFSIPKGPDLNDPVDLAKPISGVYLGTKLPNNPTGIPSIEFPVSFYNTGGFIQSQLVPNEAWALTLGLRYDYNSRYGSTWNPRAGLVFTPKSSTTFKALYGSAYFAPAPSVSYSHFGSFLSDDGGQSYYSFFWYLPNPDLKPLKEHSYELGIKQMINSDLALSVNGVYATIDNLFQEVSDADFGNRYGGEFLGWPVAYISTITNQGRQMNLGGRLQIDYSKRMENGMRLGFYTSFNYFDGTAEEYQFDSESNQNILEERQLPWIAPWFVKAGVELQKDKYSLSLRVVQSAPQRTPVFVDSDVNFERVSIDGFTMVNLAANYSFSDKIQAYLNISNLLNADIYYPTSATPQYLEKVPENPLRAHLGIRVTL